MKTDQITLAPADKADFPAFKRELQDAFSVAVIEEFGALPDGPIPSDDDLDQIMAAPGAQVLRILHQGRKIGGAVVTIDDETQINALDLFFLKRGQEGRGLGHAAWLAVERMFPQTRIWQTHTPYFEKRNIHFYVNKCGFKITAFHSRFHRDPNFAGADDPAIGDEGFLFEKIM